MRSSAEELEGNCVRLTVAVGIALFGDIFLPFEQFGRCDYVPVVAVGVPLERGSYAKVTGDGPGPSQFGKARNISGWDKHLILSGYGSLIESHIMR